MHAVNTALFGSFTYKNVITTGTLAGNDGRKMSKSLGNYTDPNELMNEYSADSLRFLLMSSPLMNAEDFSLKDRDVSDVARKLSMIWNMFDFFTLYASVDGWESPADPFVDPSSELSNPLDKWIVSRVHELTAQITENMNRYDIPHAMKPILPFLDDASNWYVRRSRRRFWKSDDDGDKQDAYRTLYYVLVRLSLVLAPFTPFLAEELFRKLTGGESVHLQDWPANGEANTSALHEMAKVREFINQGLSLRAAAKLKVRQPLASATLFGAPDMFEDLRAIVSEELNVKKIILVPGSPSLKSDQTFIESYKVRQGTSPVVQIASEVKTEIDTDLTPALKREGLMREVIRQV